MKKLLVSLLSALLCISVVAETESQLNGTQNGSDVKIDEKGNVFVAPLKYHITSDSTAEVVEVVKDGSYIELESVVIPSEIRVDGHVYSVTSIGDKAFDKCHSLTSIEIPSSVTSIGNGAFEDCDGLTSINVATDNAIYSSENGVLYDKNRTKLICVPGGKKGKFVVPSGVTRIGDDAFSFCSGLTSIEIPSSVTSIGYGAFSECSGLTSINVATDNSIYTSENGVLYDKKKTKLICVPGAKKGKFEIPSSVTSIGIGAFSGCGGLSRVKIPSNVTSIGNYAFKDCSGLTEIYIPSSVTHIEDWAFEDCKNLDVIIDNSKENVTVGRSAFRHCKSVKYLK